MIINTRYNLIKILGKGRSSVYLAEDLVEQGRLYALKIIPAENLNSDEFKSLRDEFRLLNSLNHPNIVQAYEFERVSECDNEAFVGSYFYTSEYVQGKNLLEFFVPPLINGNLDKFLFTLNQISTTLYYIHQLGIIHYDIRPENILVDEKSNGQINVKLIDFGFSALKTFKTRGTPLYISPELISGQDVDYRTDLYSLGATLYHIISGKPPFYDDDDIVLLKKHLEVEPEKLPNEIPDYLQEIVFRLLRKNRDERFKNSLEIINYLPDRFREIKKIWPIPKIYFARENDLNKLKSWIENEHLDTVNLLILSESGMGRSFLLKKFVEYLEDKGETFFFLKPSENQITPYNLLFELLNQVEDFLLQSNLTNKNELIDKISFLRGIYRDTENRLEFQQYQQNYLAEILIELAKQVKYIFIIDDFQKFDSTSQNYFYFVYPSLVDLKIKFVVSTDTSFIKSGNSEKLQNFKELILVPLSRDEIISMLKKYFHLNFPYDEVANLLVEFTDNSLRGINEFLNSLILSETLVFDSSGFKINYNNLKELKVDDLLSQTYESKIRNLTQNQKLILNILSLINFTIKLKRLSEITNNEIRELRNEVSYLASFGWIEYSGKDETVYLPEGGIKNYLFNEAKKNQTLNRLLAKYFEENNFPAFIVAEFYERAGNRKKSFDCYLLAAKEAENYFSYSLMEKFLLKCMELESDETNLVALKIKLAQCYFYQSEFKQAQSLIEAILAKSSLEQEQLFNLYLMLATINFKTGDIENAYENFNRAYNKAKTDEQKIEIEINQINLELNQGNYLIVMKKCENLLSEYNISKSLKAALLNNLGIANFKQENYDKALINFEQALEIYKELNNVTKISQQYINIGNVYGITGNYNKANENWDYSFEINKNIGDITKNALILNNKGIFAFENFDFDTAVKHYKEARQLFKKIGDSWGENIALFNLSEASLFSCEYSKALKYLKESIELSKKVFDLEGICSSLFLLGLLYYYLNCPKELKEIIKEHYDVIEANKLHTKQIQNNLYLEGLYELMNKNYDEAEIKINLSREIYKDYESKYYYCKSTVDLMWILIYKGEYQYIKKLFNELNDNDYFNKNNSIKAEALLVCGDASKRPGADFEFDSLHYYMEAFNLIQCSNINEVTWQVLLALGEEFLIKGAVKKGLEYLDQVHRIIEYLLNKINEEEYRESYLSEVKRSRAIDKTKKVMSKF